ARSARRGQGRRRRAGAPELQPPAACPRADPHKGRHRPHLGLDHLPGSIDDRRGLRRDRARRHARTTLAPERERSAVLPLRPGADDRLCRREPGGHLRLPPGRRRLRTAEHGPLYREHGHDDAAAAGAVADRQGLRRLAPSTAGVHAIRAGAGPPEDRPVDPGANLDPQDTRGAGLSSPRLVKFLVDDRNVEVHDSGSSRPEHESRIPVAGMYRDRSGTVTVSAPLGTPPAEIIKPAYSFTVNGQQLPAIEACHRYIELLERLVSDYKRSQGIG